MYRVIYDYGSYGWLFEGKKFATGKEALEWAMDEGRPQSFVVVKIVKFDEVEE